MTTRNNLKHVHVCNGTTCLHKSKIYCDEAYPLYGNSLKMVMSLCVQCTCAVAFSET